MTNPQTNALEEAMKRLWATHLPELETRVSALETCAYALHRNDNAESTLGEATAAAHKLAGVLGTFGLQNGTELARKAEVSCGEFSGNSEQLAQMLTEISAQLRTILASKSQ